MSAETARQPIDLPGLNATEMSLKSADIEIAGTNDAIKVPQLVLEGEEDAFVHTFRDGQLTLHEKGNGNGDVSVMNIGVGRSGRNRVVIGGMEFFGSGTIVVNGTQINVGEGSVNIDGGSRKASLWLPPRYDAMPYHLSTVSGDVMLETLMTRRLSIASTSGDVALRACMAERVGVNTVSGDIDVVDLATHGLARFKSVSGDIDISGGSAPTWELESVSGDIKVASSTRGQVDSHTVSGRNRIGR